MSKAELAEQEVKKEEVVVQEGTPMGFEDEEAGDMIIPRVKVIQTLSPERKEKLAEEGDIINSLTKERLNGSKFIPVFRFNNNIKWIPRDEGGGMECVARDGRIGEMQDGTMVACATCKKCEFDNTKQGKASYPTCSKYINFFGFFEGEKLPIILSFAKTNYAEGKKLFSLAKVTMQNMWNFGYKLEEKLIAKSGNEWYIITTSPAGPTSEEDRAYALSLFQQFRNSMTDTKFDVEDGVAQTDSGSSATNVDATEY